MVIPVSYTHLDVYKRQVVLTSVNLTSSEAHVLAIHNKCLPFLVPGPVRPANFVVIVFQLSVRTFHVFGKRRERVEQRGVYTQNLCKHLP